jgi:micrococcal nuclease
MTRALRSPRLPFRTSVMAGLLLAAVAGAATWAERTGWLYVWLPALAPPMIGDGGTGELLKVRDGDTVEIRYHDLSLAVRLRNIDTAEAVHPDAARNSTAGADTSAWAKRHLAGARIRVEFARRDWRIDEDRYGRALGFLWIDRDPAGPGPEDELYNETVIRKGRSAYVTGYGHAGVHHGRLAAAEAEARAAGRGIWRR